MYISSWLPLKVTVIFWKLPKLIGEFENTVSLPQCATSTLPLRTPIDINSFVFWLDAPFQIIHPCLPAPFSKILTETHIDKDQDWFPVIPEFPVTT
jgi:hypothetical protein